MSERAPAPVTMGVSTPSETMSAAAAVAMSWKKRHSFGRAASLPAPRAQPRQSSHRTSRRSSPLHSAHPCS